MSHVIHRLRANLTFAAVITLFMTFATGCASTTKQGYDIRTFMKIRTPGGVDMVQDDTVYFVYNADGVSQLYCKSANEPQEDAKKLTNFEDGLDGYSISDDGRWIVLTASVGGSEYSDMFLMSTETNEMKTLFSDPRTVYAGPVWRRDSKAFAYRANDISATDFHVYIYDLESGESRKAMDDKGFHLPVDFNRTGDKIVVLKYNSATHTQLFEVNLDSATTREITPQDEAGYFGPVGYTANEKEFLVTTNYHGDLNYVAALDMNSAFVRPLLPALNKYHVDAAGINKERTLIAVLTNEDGYGALHLHDAVTYEPVEGPKMDKGVVGNIGIQDSWIHYSLSNAQNPGIVYRWSMDEPDMAPEPITEAETFGVDLSQFRLPELIHYESSDGKMIPAFLYLPDNYRKGQKIPFIVQFHGGPESQFRPYFARSFQYFLTQGYGLIAPNVRGSSGYGKAYLEADNYKNRHKSVEDGIHAAKWLVENGYSEPKRIAAWGGSYGGYMVMAMLTEAPELFGCGCNVVGIVNFETFLEQTAEYRRHLREVEYGPLTDRSFLRSISPIHKVDQIEAPLMIAHGLNDPRVPVGEAMQIAVALKKRGLDVEELYFPDEGHGFAKEENRLLYYEQLRQFFDRYLN